MQLAGATWVCQAITQLFFYKQLFGWLHTQNTLSWLHRYGVMSAEGPLKLWADFRAHLGQYVDRSRSF